VGAVLLLALPLACGGGGGGETGGGSSSAAPFDVSGEIQIAYASAVDSDVNDPAAPYLANDTPATAQPLPNPVTLGGHANVANQGPPGRTRTLGDVLDYFRVSLAGGQTVRLFMSGDGSSDDLDLALLTEAGTPLLLSDGSTPTESIVVPASGEYLILVSAFAGESSYVLSIGQATNAIAAAPPEFVPGQVIVRMRDGAPAARARSAAAASADALGLDAVAATPDGGPLLLAAGDATQLEDAVRAAGAGHLVLRSGAPSAFGVRSADRTAQMRLDTQRLAKALRKRPDVLSADLNYIRRPSATPADEFYPLQWHYPMVRLPEAWDLVAPNSGIVVAVIDTGIVAAHPEFAGQLVAGYDFIADPARARDGNGCDGNPNDPGDSATPGSSSFHGTHVAGTVVAATSLGGGGDGGVAGVAWNAKAMPLRALGVDGGTDFDVIQALRYAGHLSNACGSLPAAAADVVNLSLGSPDPSAALDAAIAEVRAAGVVVVAAAGNSGNSVPQYPAASPGVISVVAVDADEQLAFYSNFGSTVDLAAPGGDLSADLTFDGFGDGVLSTLFDDEGNDYVYAFYQGTSMATPHVAGVIALMLGVNPALTPADIDTLLAAGSMTRNIGSSFSFGRGLLDAFEAVSAAIAAKGGALPTLPPQLAADPGALNFGAQGNQAAVAISNSGGNVPPLSVTSTETLEDDGGSWLGVAATSVNGSGLGSYTVSVDRTGLADGIYTGAVRFHSTAGDLDVPVIMQVGTAVSSDANAGHHYVVLVDPATFTNAGEVQVEANGGHYSFTLSGVEPGEYFVYAGTDTDNDGVICDRGEACGAYPTLDQPRALVVNGDENGVGFLTGFGLRLGIAGVGGGDGDEGGISRRVVHGVAPSP
jgi:serine protease